MKEIDFLIRNVLIIQICIYFKKQVTKLDTFFLFYFGTCKTSEIKYYFIST